MHGPNSGHRNTRRIAKPSDLLAEGGAGLAKRDERQVSSIGAAVIVLPVALILGRALGLLLLESLLHALNLGSQLLNLTLGPPHVLLAARPALQTPILIVGGEVALAAGHRVEFLVLFRRVSARFDLELI